MVINYLFRTPTYGMNCHRSSSKKGLSSFTSSIWIYSKIEKG